MRKWGLVVVAIALVVGLVACGGDDGSSSAQTTTSAAPAKVSGFTPVTAGTLTVVTSLPGPGFWEGSDTDPTKIKSGYEYDIAKQMETAFGLHKLVVLNKPFDTIVAGQVTKNDYDLSLSQISITCDRAKVVDFSVPYFQSNQGVLVRTGTKVPSAAVAKNLRWGVQTSTTAVDLLKTLGAPNVQSFKDLPTGY